MVQVREKALLWTAVALAGAVGLLLAAALGVRHGVDAGAAERHLEGLLSGPERRADVEVGRAEARLLGRTARLEDVSVRLEPGPGAGGDDEAVEVEAETADLDGVSLWALTLGGALRAEALRLERPSVTLRGDGREASPGGPRGERPEDEPAVAIGRLEVRDGRLTVPTGAGAAAGDGARTSAGHVAEGIALTLTDVSLGRRERGGLPLRLQGGGEARLERYRGPLGGRMHAVELRGAAASVEGDSVRVDSVRLRPLPDEDGFVRRLEYRADRVQLAAGPVRARGLDVRGLVRGERLRARRVDVGSPAIAVHSDKRLPVRSGQPPPVMPPERLRDAGLPVTIDTVRVRDGRVAYSERTEAAERPGRVSFEKIDATVLRLTNDSARAREEGPALMRVTARIFGAALLRAEFEVPVLSPDLDFTFAGELGEMDLRSLNDMLEPVDGLRVEDGRLERLSFEGRVRSGRAIGAVRGRYRELAVVKVDPESGDQDLPDMVESALLDAEIENANPSAAGGEPRIGRIDHRRSPDDPFFQFLWESLRSGLLELAGA